MGSGHGWLVFCWWSLGVQLVMLGLSSGFGMHFEFAPGSQLDGPEGKESGDGAQRWLYWATFVTVPGVDHSRFETARLIMYRI